MKPLGDIQTFLKRFDNFKGGEFRSLEVLSPTAMSVTLAGQDEARGFDWVSMKLEFNGVSDARLLDESKLSLLDMNDGISIVSEGSSLAFGIGECYTLPSIKNSSCFILSTDIRQEEGTF
ncbi:MAG: hypothetical protein H8E76_06985 [Helicobacteraceae bacterium]|nr:hypothetical protein [Candidatus Sulfurimonas ponti]MBL6973361.1 hypothetical protein [Sulfurimonas sp.]